MNGLILSPKYKAFLRCRADMEVLEGTTTAGKTTVGLVKFILKVAASPKRQHILAAEDTGAAEKNIITKELGILDDFGSLVEYNGNGSRDNKMPHLLLHTEDGDRVIYVVGYRDRKRWKDVLGGQYGCVYIDEINTADMDFVREAAMRCDYLMATLNPDDPDLPVYGEYINRCRPLPEWESGTPAEIRNALSEPVHPGWVHWFFSFDDNAALTPEKKAKIIGSVPKGTKQYKNKIEGLRGRAEGLVFPNFREDRHTVSREWLRGQLTIRAITWAQLSAGLDTSYSAKSHDTVAMTMQGITTSGRLFILEEKVINNAGRGVPFAPSDIAAQFVDFLDMCARTWGMYRNVFVDSADQATITELQKYRRAHPYPYIVNPSYKTPVIDRINLQGGWIETGHYTVLTNCTEHIRELNRYSYNEKGVPEDGNDHTINSCQYGWIPYQNAIGVNRGGSV